PFDEQFKIAGDFDWCVRAVKAIEKVKKAKNLGGIFRVDGGGLSAGGSERQKWENSVVSFRSGRESNFSREFLQDKGYRVDEVLYKGEYKHLV
ncbi:MAG: hypothetical protein JNN11_04480, partial [Candidatus Doudnabacteria bacterium]|nr:hypothetical protein [Candidatus Doudnabacteria bacterium]